MKIYPQIMRAFYILSIFILFSFNNSMSGCSGCRAISMRAYQEKLRSCQKQNNFTNELKYFFNINKIIGCLIDETSDDLIILGEVNPDLPPILFDDFVIALKSVWLKYRDYYNPICSIDPDPNVLLQLNELARSIMGSTSISQTESYIKQWKETCKKPQSVLVKGIPFNSHYASVLVTADYDMKSIADGADSLAIPGFYSVTDMILNKTREDILHNRPVSVSLSMNRFWFCPDSNLYDSDDGIVFIEKCPVKLLTEAMYLSSKKLLGTNTKNSFAEQFAQNFTLKYQEISQIRPIYNELETMFYLYALANIIKYKYEDIVDKIDFNFLLNEYTVPQTVNTEQLPGRSNIKRFHQKIDEYNEVYLWLPSCGGVDVSIEMKPGLFRKISKGLLSLKQSIINAKPSKDAIYWDYQYYIKSFITQNGEEAFLEQVNSSNKFCHIIRIEEKPDGFIAINGTGQVLYDNIDDKSAFINAIKNYLHTTKDKTIYFYPKTPMSELKLDAFITVMKIQQSVNNIHFKIKAFKSIYEFQDYFLYKVNSVNIGIPKYENGKWTATIEFLLNKDGEFKNIFLRIYSATINTAQEFLKTLKATFSKNGGLYFTPGDLVNDSLIQMDKDRKHSSEEILMLIENECQGKNVVYIPIKQNYLIYNLYANN